MATVAVILAKLVQTGSIWDALLFFAGVAVLIVVAGKVIDRVRERREHRRRSRL